MTVSSSRETPGNAPPPLRTRVLAFGYGLLCHALFAVGVGAMIRAMFFGMSRSFGAVPPPWSLVANVLLLAQFPLLHSFFLTRKGGAALKRLAPAAHAGRLSTTLYVSVAALETLALFALWTPSGVVWWSAEGVATWVLTALYAASWLLLAKSIFDAGASVQFGSLGWRSLATGKPPRFPPMPERGLFRLVRQPIYVSFALTTWTVPTWTPDQLAVALVLSAYCVAGPVLKERRFRARFGAQFDAYAARTPFWLPWPRPRGARSND